ncbi:alpha/beta hydrolase [Aeromicrobium wangtongii]|uniref:Alpha/beta hydrolase n=1 Tax=Aeromicrobium wangtongii TaxID=2969247 RepID=A0ABY5ME24_9ACTN|nr:alpha/beta hydrolase [Aeromicrobium wangtongii]MCD9197918.1 alpha/beta hydrolase [Aeromicrobium wangtongii]UUP15396.1 alpha/beta hydrolase [Aeromicrobium wangtongii]
MNSHGTRTLDEPSAGAKFPPPPPFDAESAVVLPDVIEAWPQPMGPEGIPALRVMMESFDATNEILERNGDYRVEERLAPGLNGDPDIPLILCIPTAATGPVPVLYNMHGGGQVSGTHRNGLSASLDLAAPHGLAVVSVDYRLAPEHPDPAPVNDSYAGLLWLSKHADEFGLDADRIVVFGSSGGGGLAAGITLMSRDRGGPVILAQMLQCPMLDDRLSTISSHQLTEAGNLTRGSVETCWNALVGSARGSENVSPYAAPARVADLSGLPPTYIDVGSADPLRDESVAYASTIWQSGGIAELHVWPGMYHGSEFEIPTAALSIAAINARENWLRRILN